MPSINQDHLPAKNGGTRPADLSADLKASVSRAGQEWGRVARWLFLLSTNTLATLLVVAAAVAFARQVISWWKEPSPPERLMTPRSPGAMPPASLLPPKGTPQLPAEGTAVSFFGAIPWAWSRHVVEGSGETVIQQLAELTAHYGQLASDSGDQEADAETKFAPVPISALGSDTSVWMKETIGPGLEAWLLPASTPVSVAVRTLSPRTPAATSDWSEGPQQQSEASASKRAVAFGIARQLKEQTWQLDLFWYRGLKAGPSPVDLTTGEQYVPASTESRLDTTNTSQADDRDTPAGPWLTSWVPPEASVIVALDTPLLGAQVLFRGAGPPQAWMEYFNKLFVSEGWQAQEKWTRQGNCLRQTAWRATEGGSAYLEVAILPADRGDYYGLVLLERIRQDALSSPAEAVPARTGQPQNRD
ncbi:MAG: hypothetical protein NZ899_03840 [Thermoguttaceae bacterium]|nr:hypothetical protein [Thermoguttaceae bacterium]MDW8077735.1 hypothetical protein [Thermoguttaceae bacterium]